MNIDLNQFASQSTIAALSSGLFDLEAHGSHVYGEIRLELFLGLPRVSVFQHQSFTTLLITAFVTSHQQIIMSLHSMF